MPDLDRYLYDQLRSKAAGVDVPAGDIDAVMARGRRRRHRRAGASVLAVMAAAGSVTGVVVSHSSSGRAAQISVGSPTNLPAAPGDQLTWRVVPATAGLSDLTSLSSSGSIAYAVSTAPGVVAAGNEPAQQLYRTADGLSWTTATGPTGVSADGVAVDGNRVYTVGTGPATAATGDSGAWTTAVSWTDNGGGSWQNSVLPVDLNAPAGTVTVNDEAVNVAAGPKGVVAAVSISATADLSKLVPGVSAKTLWTANTNGVEVLGSQVSSQCGVSVADTHDRDSPAELTLPRRAELSNASVAIKLKAQRRATGGVGGHARKYSSPRRAAHHGSVRRLRTARRPALSPPIRPIGWSRPTPGRSSISAARWRNCCKASRWCSSRATAPTSNRCRCPPGRRDRHTSRALRAASPWRCRVWMGRLLSYSRRTGNTGHWRRSACQQG
jgi:hypothetical protein